MPGAHHNAMPHGHQCTPLPQTRGQSSELCRVRRMLRPGRRPGGRGQGPLSRDVPRMGVARPLGATPMEESPGTCRPTRRGDQLSGGASWLCRLPTPTCPPRVPHPPGWCGEARRLGAATDRHCRAVVVAWLWSCGPSPRLMGRMGVTVPGGGRMGVGASGRAGTAGVEPSGP